MTSLVRILLIGDIVGKPGRRIVQHHLAAIRLRHQLDIVIANGENAAEGSGITPLIYHDLIAAGVDCITLGDHIYRRKEIYSVLETESRIVKPANFPATAPGKNWAIVTAASGVRVLAFESGRTLLLEQDELAKLVKQHRVSLLTLNA